MKVSCLRQLNRLFGDTPDQRALNIPHASAALLLVVVAIMYHLS